VSIPAWFTMDTRLGCLSVHLDTPQCFSAEMYAMDLNLTGFNEDSKVTSILSYSIYINNTTGTILCLYQSTNSDFLLVRT
jgi:hypothetical protein